MSGTKCPQCDVELKKCLIQQNYSMVMCPNLACSYPFNERDALSSTVYTKDSEILDAAKKRLRQEEQKDGGES
ncbi:LAME_0F17216g1_1 [Lachancea meyersii CBS 8951]|uniref:LAME_0F17216g1_1 n=1 Tax=Lachancea meyersii CBS 8951 TaxID=1266667 RepID=A0A1G4K005_9SACH|nr:LAME_0F17216g1_1 [Lachancea meyersii CBS 8951]